MRMFLSADMVGVFYTGYSQHLSKNHRDVLPVKVSYLW